MSEFEPLDYLRVPLQGTNLIEASAGTGKTYTLTALYVRLILGHGTTPDCGDSGQPPTPKDILVLTFTRAATQELRQRIRTRLSEAAETFRCADTASRCGGESALQAVIDDTGDNFLHDLLVDVSADVDLGQYVKRCADAAQAMDLAAVHTIHSFCQRSLKRFAFAAGMAFDQELQTDTEPLFDEIRNDYWRRHIQPLSDAASNALIDKKIGSPAALAQAIRDFEPGEPQPFPAAVEAMEDELQSLYEVRAKAQSTLAEQRQQLMDWVRSEIEAGHLKQAQDTKKTKTALDEFLGSGKNKAGLEYFTPDGLQWKAGEEQDVPEELTCLDDIAEFLAQAEEAPEFPLDELLQHATDWIDAEKDNRLKARTQITYNTMVTRLADALEAESSQDTRPLAQQLFEAYPCTLIDEFQDTDQDQYDIFRHIYAGRESASFAWLMIGDPKQGIYSFRGADIKVYEAASRTTDRRYTLATNFRSSAGMVAACNHVFISSPLEEENGGAFGTDDIRYRQIGAQGRDDELLIDGEPATPLTICHADSDTPLGKGEATRTLADDCATRVAEILAKAGNDRAVITMNNDRSTAVEPNDIACLVRTGKQGQILKNALKANGVDAVVLSEKNSVYDSAAALDLFRILSAVARPHDGVLVRQALASDLLAFEPNTLVAEFTDEERWQQHLRTFRELRDDWQRLGVLPMVHRLVHELALPERQRDERVLTDLFHLAELLQQASVRLDGMDALLHYLEMAIASDDKGNDDNDELLLRLENERDRVIIMTLHGAKGLEFPLVMLPFNGLAQGKDWEDDADEEMRLLYVGITRAAHACWLGLVECNYGGGKTHQLETTPLGRLLFGDEHRDGEAMLAALGSLSDESDGTVQLAQTQPEIAGLPNESAALPPLADADNRQPRRPADWTVTSYSRLASPVSRGTFNPASERMLEDGGDAATPPGAAGQARVHEFPRGPEAGNLLHWVLEQACNQGFATLDDASTAQLADRACGSDRWQAYSAQLHDWLPRILNTPLPFGGQATALRDVDTSLAENEFWLRLRHARLERLEAYARQLLPGDRSPFPTQRINGMLKGFIDLLFCVDGRYYVLDYKSNHLGAGDAAYTPDAMARAMLDHRYELQGLIYQVALHRLLRQRLPDYDPARHLGGSLFFFLRGIGHESRGIVHLPADVDLLAGVDALFEGEAA